MITFIQLTSSIADNGCSILIEEVVTHTAIGVVVADLNSSHSLTLTGLTSIHQPDLSISAVCGGSSGTCWAWLTKGHTHRIALLSQCSQTYKCRQSSQHCQYRGHCGHSCECHLHTR